MLSGTRANLAIKIFGDDLQQLRDRASRQAAVQGIDGLVDLSVEQQTDIPTVRVQLRPRRAGTVWPAVRRRGGGARDGAGRPRGGTDSGRAGRRAAGHPVPAADEPDLEAIRHTPLRTATGGRVPVSAVADIREDRSPNFISRENVQRKITVTANVAGRDLGQRRRGCANAVGTRVTLPTGYRIEYSGQFESSEQAASLLFLAEHRRRRRDVLHAGDGVRIGGLAGLIMVNLPLALIGGIAGVFVSGGVLSIASIIGLIALLGIAARNGIMLVSHIEHLRHEEGVTDLRRR
jgi:Cu/Ag efflux pump CusA